MSDSLKIFEHLHTLQHQFRAHMRSRLEAEHPQLTLNEARILMHTARHSGLSQKDLLEHSHIDKAQLTRLLSTLESKGWMTRTACVEDKRARVLHLSPAGMQQVTALDALQQAVTDEVLSAWPTAARQQLLALLEAHQS